MILIVSTCKDPLSEYEFVKPLERIVQKCCEEYTVVSYREIKEGVWDKIIITGTALKDFDYIKYIKNFLWLQESYIPVLGICAGSQIITKIFGGKLEDYLIIGRKKVEIMKENPLVPMEKIYSYFITSKVPRLNKRFEIIGKLNGIPVFFSVKYTRIYGVVFHPEVFNENLIINFVKRL
ncbi:MAG TPA: hypothetical protein EYH09_00730 [Candidatus Nanopusillus sp.]|nr:hypothetical protein [Candidatus Nanopusillus sp.]